MLVALWSRRLRTSAETMAVVVTGVGNSFITTRIAAAVSQCTLSNNNNNNNNNAASSRKGGGGGGGSSSSNAMLGTKLWMPTTGSSVSYGVAQPAGGRGGGGGSVRIVALTVTIPQKFR